MTETPDDLFENDEDAAASEAGAIGGKRPNYYDDNDESQRPLEEAGEGESEGFELAEEDLIEEASHGDEGRDPEVDGWDEEDEIDSVYGEADDVEEPDL
jgi:hypothetical protein